LIFDTHESSIMFVDCMDRIVVRRCTQLLDIVYSHLSVYTWSLYTTLVEQEAMQAGPIYA